LKNEISAPVIGGVNHITLAVSNIERSFIFYRDVLGFKPLCRWHAGAYFTVGELWLCLSLDSEATKSIRSDYTHYAFSIPIAN
jgi:catechol 2,3-dioxygenase-like lactoylglutathione lyase family enzyme